MNLQLEKQDNFSIATLNETRLDASIATDFKRIMEQFIDDGHNHIILDISQLSFMDSSSLGATVSILKKLGTSGKLVISGASGSVLDLFQLTRMDKIFTLKDNLDLSKQHFKSTAISA